MTHRPKPRTPTAEPVYFATAADFRTWLERHGADTAALIVGFHKVGSGERSITWPESVDEALCVGWIDGVRTRIDDQRYKIRFSPRKPGSIWSAVNVANVERLAAQGRMRPAGLEAYGRRIERLTAVYAYEQAGTRLEPAHEQHFRRHDAAWSFFEACPPSYRKVMLHWVSRAKREDTRERRLGQLIDACARKVRLLK